MSPSCHPKYGLSWSCVSFDLPFAKDFVHECRTVALGFGGNSCLFLLEDLGPKMAKKIEIVFENDVEGINSIQVWRLSRAHEICFLFWLGSCSMT